MAMVFELHPGGRRCTIRLTGTITYSDIDGGIREQIAAGAWQAETVIDAARAEAIATGFDDSRRVVRTLHNLSGVLPPRGPVVIVVGDNSAIYGMARQYEQVLASENVHQRVAIIRSGDDVDAAFAQLGASSQGPE
ncbi:MAG TPA: hypothetical protein VM032_06950 [Vicinamibacterales bacterium]|nr:hypothetical protein [Vicinamibacterales bacterium]